MPTGTKCSRCDSENIRRHGRIHGMDEADPSIQLWRCMGCHRLFYMPHRKVD